MNVCSNIMMVLVASSAAAQQPGTPAPAPATPAVVETTAKIVAAPTKRPPGTPVRSADDLLTDLENAGDGMRQLKADLRRTRNFSDLEGGGSQEWTGRVLFENPLPPTPGAPVRRRFQIEFDSTILNGNVKQNDGQVFIFDGEWLIEKKPTTKEITRTQMVPPGQNIDPLSLENGVFPLPIGQRKSAILEKFDAQLLPPDDYEPFKGEGKLPEALKDTYQLRLTPKPGSPGAKDLDEIRIWYRKSDLLPRLAFTAERNGNSNEYFLTRVSTTDALPAGAFDGRTPAGWTEENNEYRGGSGGNTPPADAGRSGK